MYESFQNRTNLTKKWETSLLTCREKSKNITISLIYKSYYILANNLLLCLTILIFIYFSEIQENNSMRNKLFLSAIIATASLSISGCAVHVSAHGKHKYEDLDSVFGGVSVGKGALVRDVSSVNGGVELASNSSARDVDTVNGGIDISDDVKIRSAETVNGGIDGGRNLSVEKISCYCQWRNRTGRRQYRWDGR